MSRDANCVIQTTRHCTNSMLTKRFKYFWPWKISWNLPRVVYVWIYLTFFVTATDINFSC